MQGDESCKRVRHARYGASKACEACKRQGVKGSKASVGL